MMNTKRLECLKLVYWKGQDNYSVPKANPLKQIKDAASGVLYDMVHQPDASEHYIVTEAKRPARDIIYRALLPLIEKEVDKIVVV